MIYEQEDIMISCQNLKFSDFYSSRRISAANKIIGEKTVKNIIGYALYLLGVSRKSVSESLSISYDTFKSHTERIDTEGLSALVDRRIKPVSLPETKRQFAEDVQKVRAYFQDDYLFVTLESGSLLLKIPLRNSIQVKTILLTLYENELIGKQSAAQLLDYSPVHIQRLSQKLQNNDIGLFIDKRHGQQKDYKCNQEIKAELFQHYIANLVTGQNVSSERLSENLSERCNIVLPSRTIRFHIKKSGLSKIKKTLPALIESLKKTPKFNHV